MIRQHEDVSNIRQTAAPQERLQGKENGLQSAPSGFSNIIGSYL